MSDATASPTSGPKRSAARANRAGRRIRRRRNRIVLWSLLAVAAVTFASLLWVGIRGWMAKGELESAVPIASQLKDAALQNDTDSVTRLALDLHRHATAARDLTGDPIWRLAEAVPGVGVNLSAARELSSTIESL